MRKSKLSLLIVVVSLLFAGCDSNLMQVEPTNEVTLEENLSLSQFELMEFQEMTDFSNMRQGDFTGRFLIISSGPNLPNNLERSIKSAGGEIVKTFPQIGVAVAVANSPGFLGKARKIGGLEAVAPDIILQYTTEPENMDADLVVESSNAGANAIGTPFNYQDAILDGFQWAPASINGPAAWDGGFTGEGVRVAVIDGGFHSTHQDLAPNLDIPSSRSFVDGFHFNEDIGTFWHGTHVAGIVAAAGVGIVGIAPEATIIGVKSLHGGSGSFEAVLSGILYAATPQSEGGAGAQIINMSLGATIDYRTDWQDKEWRDLFRDLQTANDRATRYANQNGVTVIAAAGNSFINLDDAKEFAVFPAESQHVLSISSTGPTGWLLGNTNFTQPSYFTSYGKSLVDFAGPGGSAGLLVIDGNGSNCTLNGFSAPCYVFDMVLSCQRGFTNGSYTWAQGTSMSAPAAAGVAALIIQANGGQMNPAQVRSRMSQSATDLGKPGKDEFYGFGYINAAKAVGLN